MNLTWFQSLLYGLFAGLADILPVSAQAHRQVLLTLCGETGEPVLLRLMTHAAMLAVLYSGCRGQLLRMSRARKLAKVPKRRRKRPLDRDSLMDMSLLKTGLVPIVLAFLFYGKTSVWGSNLLAVAALLLVNGLVLFIPQYLPGSNKEAASLTRVEGLLMGAGNAASILPGVSGVGTAVSVGSVCGVDRAYGLNMALLMNIPVNVGFLVYDIMDLVAVGLGGLGFVDILMCLLSAVLTFLGGWLGVRIMRKLAGNSGFGIFAFYSWGMALFTFILYLTT